MATINLFHSGRHVAQCRVSEHLEPPRSFSLLLFIPLRLRLLLQLGKWFGLVPTALRKVQVGQALGLKSFRSHCGNATLHENRIFTRQTQTDEMFFFFSFPILSDYYRKSCSDAQLVFLRHRLNPESVIRSLWS